VETMESGELPTSLPDVARALVAPGKGILAADESHPTMAKRLATIGLDSSADLRLAYRELLLTSPGLSEHVSGVILFDETIRQFTHGGAPFAEALAGAGIVPGIKVDGGTTPLAGFLDEVVTQGLDGLRDRLVEYAALGPGSPSGAP
jgi:fructose-bisphosphate aldolase, class I